MQYCSPATKGQVFIASYKKSDRSRAEFFSVFSTKPRIPLRFYGAVFGVQRWTSIVTGGRRILCTVIEIKFQKHK